LTSAKFIEQSGRNSLYNHRLAIAKEPARLLTGKSLQILELLWENGNRNIVYTCHMNQSDLARKLQITRQALGIHVKRLRERGLLQIGRGFVNVTEEGLKAFGFQSNPVIVTVRISPQSRQEAFRRVKLLPVLEVFRVTGEVDLVLIVHQENLDYVLEMLSGIPGVVDTKSFVTMEVPSHEYDNSLQQ